MAALVGGHLHLLRLMTGGGGGLAHQVCRLKELGLLSRVRANGPGHLGGGPVQPGCARWCLSLV